MTFPTNSNNSATGGYLLPAAPSPLPGDLTFEQFIQTVFVGISGLAAQLVLPKWQENPPQWPDAGINWMSVGLSEDDADTYAYNSIDDSGNNVFQRFETLVYQCSFYGPQALLYTKLLRDGFQLPQNREALRSIGMDFTSTSKAVRAPDLINERWINRWEMSVNLKREILRVYPILTFVSLSGTLNVLGSTAGVRTSTFSVTEGDTYL